MMNTKDIGRVMTSAVPPRFRKVRCAAGRMSRSIGDAALVVIAMVWQCWHPRYRQP
jgi:hypothetical protein